jgi:UDP-glucuronate 4-epimerase
MAMLKFAHKMVRGETIEVYNHGKLRRDFTYIDDIVAGFAQAVETPLGYEIINLGGGRPVELMTYIELLESALGVTAKQEPLPMQLGDVYETYADTKKATELLGFKAEVDIETGIKAFADWFTAYYQPVS